MKKSSRYSMTVLCFYFLINVMSAFSQVRLPRLISDGMVLQRNTDLKIWGWASAGETVTLKFINKTYQGVANSDGKWLITLPPQQAGGPYKMEITASNSIAIADIMIGDVWICSGQSNMELPMRRVSWIYELEIANAANTNIRQFSVPQKYNFNEPLKDLTEGRWKAVNPQTVLDFSAVAYFFAKELYDKYKVPIGLVNCSLGGSPAEAWMSEEALKKFPVYYQETQKFKDSSLIKKIEYNDNTRTQAWYKLLSQKDEGYKDNSRTWRDPMLNTSDWATMKIPGYWANTGIGAVNGIVWFRKEIQIPASIVGTSANLILGRIVDGDSAFINGVFVGTTGYQYPPRRYTIPAGLLKEGKNTIIIKVISNGGKGGFVPDKPYEIVSDGKTIDLKGDWQYRLGATMEPLAGQTFIRWKPEGLYNAMIHPLLNYQIKGVIWYQGEANTSRALEYRKLFPALIRDWRTNWQQSDFPFLFVQLANFMEAKSLPGESDWALLRESQLKTLALPNTGMAVITDIGEWNDIHPLNKKDVGKRLALAAQKIAYGEKEIVYSGPIYQSMQIDRNKIILLFSNTGSGLVAKGGTELKYFAISGADKKFVWAKAKIEGNKVVVWSDQIPSPIAVRYAWADNPEGANLYNKEGLPASSFRTDD